MRFSIWLEAEASMGANMPDMMASMPNNSGNTPASDEVKRTGLQPQVDSQEIHTKEKNDQDKLLAIDANIDRFDKEVPQGSDYKTTKINKFRELWKDFKAQWDDIKMKDDADTASNDSEGLGSNGGNNDYVNTMRQHPNMVPGQQNYTTNSGSIGMG